MAPKFSIVITTLNHLEDCLKPCITSIVQHTDLSNVEVIVVANGCTDKTKEYVEGLGEPFKLVWFDDAIGYTKAANAGMAQSRGQFCVLLNNDVVLLPQPKGEWLRMLEKPFLAVPNVGITGPSMNMDENSKRYFLVFFCVMIKKEAYEKVGVFDEIFSPGFGEDTDWCIRAERIGYKAIQVPHRDKLVHGEGKLMIGGFPIFHHGEKTFDDDPDKFRDLINRNSTILASKYEKELPMGHFSNQDIDVYKSFVGRGPRGGRIAEIGVWKGRSLCSVRDVIVDHDLKVVAVDSFEGTKSEEWGLAEEANQVHIQDVFERGLDKFKFRDRVSVVREDSSVAAKLFPDDHFSCVFIDADHSYESVKKDIDAWWDKVNPGGILCGHDYMWGGVQKAITEKFGAGNIHTDTCNMWYVDKPRVFDCFMFSNELDVLEIRMNELKDVVYKFVVVEATVTQSGLPKQLHFKENIDRFKQFKDKIVHIIVEDMPQGEDPWGKERFQRDAIVRGLKDMKDDDIIIISDVDEIPRAETVKNYRKEQGIVSLEQQMSYYFVNYVSKEKWDWLKIVPYSLFKKMTPCQVRYTANTPKILNGGWHFSFLGGTDKIIEKIQSYAHQEYNTPDILDRSRIEKLVDEGKDVFGRGVEYDLMPVDETYPKYLQENTYKFRNLIRHKDSTNDLMMETVKDIMDTEVTAVVSTKDRYFTSLPNCLISIALQTRKPQYLIVYDDGEHKDLRNEPIYQNIFSLLSMSGIAWTVNFGEGKGQVKNHQKSLSDCQTEWIWRIDDDTVMEPDVLEKLVKHIAPGVGAVGGLVIDPKMQLFESKLASNKIEDIYLGMNAQWFKKSNTDDVDHLYSTFIYRKKASSHGYCMELSRVGHREETMFTYEMKRNGWKLIIDPTAVTWHLRNPLGGIRSDSDQSMWAHDEQIFAKKMAQWGVRPRETKLCVLDSGFGDHLVFKAVLPDIKKKYKEVVVANCYNEVFSDDKDIKMVSIAEANMTANVEELNIYKFMWDHNWQDSLEKAYRKMYLNE